MQRTHTVCAVPDSSTDSGGDRPRPSNGLPQLVSDITSNKSHTVGGSLWTLTSMAHSQLPRRT